eukprot:7350672-Pyramimonas_sp.AAC.1
MAQLGGLVLLPPGDTPGGTDQIFFFGGIDSCRFKKTVIPGDKLEMHVELIKMNPRFGIAKMKGKGSEWTVRWGSEWMVRLRSEWTVRWSWMAARISWLSQCETYTSTAQPQYRVDQSGEGRGYTPTGWTNQVRGEGIHLQGGPIR